MSSRASGGASCAALLLGALLQRLERRLQQLPPDCRALGSQQRWQLAHDLHSTSRLQRNCKWFAIVPWGMSTWQLSTQQPCDTYLLVMFAMASSQQLRVLSGMCNQWLWIEHTVTLASWRLQPTSL